MRRPAPCSRRRFSASSRLRRILIRPPAGHYTRRSTWQLQPLVPSKPTWAPKPTTCWVSTSPKSPRTACTCPALILWTKSSALPTAIRASLRHCIVCTIPAVSRALATSPSFPWTKASSTPRPPASPKIPSTSTAKTSSSWPWKAAATPSPRPSASLAQSRASTPTKFPF